MTDTQGRYGTLRLISTKSGKAVSSFPVDVDVLTFGRDISCDVRMYFVTVSSLHAKLVFEDSKPFLSVMGASGVMVDGHHILPSAGSGEPTIVPLQDHSLFIIHNKIFRFDYPTSSTRPILTTPQAKRRRSLRMSMVNAAIIMTPNTRVTPTSPSLETLQSPVRPFINDAKTRAEREQEVVLAEGDNVLVVKQGGDLVVTETLPDDEEDSNESTEEDSLQDFRGRSPQRTLPPQSSDTSGSTASATGSNLQPPLSTPPSRSRSSSRFSLHKAVLVRNSQRALLDKNDEEEVTRVITPERNVGPYSHSTKSLDEEVEALEREQSNDMDVEIADPEDGEDAEVKSEDGEDTKPNEDTEPMEGSEPHRRSLSLRASIEAIGNALIAPFSGRWSGGETKPGEEDAAELAADQSKGATASVEDAEDVDEPQESEQDAPLEEVPATGMEEVLPNEEDRLDQRSAEAESPAPASPKGEQSLQPEPAKIPFEPKEFTFRPFYTPQPRRTTNMLRPSLGGNAENQNSSSTKSRRMRFTNFGLPDYIVNTTVADVDEEVDQVLKQEDNDYETPPVPPVTPPRQVFSRGLENTETASTPTLESLRKLSQHLEIDNAKRANRLSFGLSPMRPRAPSFRPSFGGASSRPALEPIASQRDAEEAAATTEEDDDDESNDSSDAGGGNENVPPFSRSPLRDSSVSTPSRSAPIGSDVGPKTPSFTGFRNLFAQPAKPPPTPSFIGVRRLFRDPSGGQSAEEPSTPNFSGVSDMFAPPEQDSTDEARDATPKPLPRRFVTPLPSSTTTNGVAGGKDLLPIPTRRSRSCSRSAAPPQPTSESVARSRPPSRQLRTKTPELSVARSEPPASKSSSSRNSAIEGSHVSRSSRRRTPVATPSTPDPDPDAQEKNAERTASQPKRARTPRAVEVMITTRSPKISPPRVRTTRAASGSKRAHASDTDDGKIVASSLATRSSERNRGPAAVEVEMVEVEVINLVSSEDEPPSMEKLTRSPPSGQTRKRPRNVKATTPETAPVAKAPTSPKRGTRLPVRSSRGGLSRGGATVLSGAQRRAPPRDRSGAVEEAESEKEAPVVSSGTRSSTRVTASASRISKATPIARLTKATNLAIPASDPAPVRLLRTRSAGKK